ncbi:10755_t:CDS:2 [Funneliformis geosporum]|nr:10755_t:CDS:2 [Funneliformis geosporum]
MQVDRTGLICDVLIQPFEIITSQAYDYASYCCTTNSKTSRILLREGEVSQLAELIETNENECGNSLIRIPLQIFHDSLGGGMLPIKIDRNSKDQGTTMIGNKRPDFLCWTNNVLIFKGEEKVEVKEFQDAVEELEEKFNKFDPTYFGNIQFMFVTP